jgi:hypothetical protein
MKIRFVSPEKPQVLSLEALIFAALDSVNYVSQTVQLKTGGTGLAEKT